MSGRLTPDDVREAVIAARKRGRPPFHELAGRFGISQGTASNICRPRLGRCRKEFRWTSKRQRTVIYRQWLRTGETFAELGRQYGLTGPGIRKLIRRQQQAERQRHDEAAQ